MGERKLFATRTWKTDMKLGGVRVRSNHREGSVWFQLLSWHQSRFPVKLQSVDGGPFVVFACPLFGEKRAANYACMHALELGAHRSSVIRCICYFSPHSLSFACTTGYNGDITRPFRYTRRCSHLFIHPPCQAVGPQTCQTRANRERISPAPALSYR